MIFNSYITQFSSERFVEFLEGKLKVSNLLFLAMNVHNPLEVELFIYVKVSYYLLSVISVKNSQIARFERLLLPHLFLIPLPVSLTANPL